MERKKWRGGGGRRDGLCLLLVVCRCASPEISAQPDNHDWPANPLPTYVPLAVICSNSNQPPALHPARIRSCLAHFFQKQHESCAGLARDKDTDALTPARSVTSYQNKNSPASASSSHAAFREAPIVPSFPPTLTHRPRFWAAQPAVLRDLG